MSNVWEARWKAQKEAEKSMLAASKRVNRASAKIGDIDVTEDVVSVLDALVGSLDWGSGFLDDDEIAAVSRLAELLNVEV